MPNQIGRDELRELTTHGSQLVEVLLAEDYEWAHLPGAVNHPLKELPNRAAGPVPPGHRYRPDWF